MSITFLLSGMGLSIWTSYKVNATFKKLLQMLHRKKEKINYVYMVF